MIGVPKKSICMSVFVCLSAYFMCLFVKTSICVFLLIILIFDSSPLLFVAILIVPVTHSSQNIPSIPMHPTIYLSTHSIIHPPTHPPILFYPAILKGLLVDVGTVDSRGKGQLRGDKKSILSADKTSFMITVWNIHCQPLLLIYFVK